MASAEVSGPEDLSQRSYSAAQGSETAWLKDSLRQ